MNFTMKDFDTAIAVNMNDTVNIQHKKEFDLADVVSDEIKLENDDWNIDSIFPLNNDFLNELGDINMDANWTDAYDYLSSPISTGTESSENEHDMLGMKPIANQMFSPPQNLISSSSSDSGLSSDHVDFDMNLDKLNAEFLQQPLLSNQVIPEPVEKKPIHNIFLNQEPKKNTVVRLQTNNTTMNKIVTREIPEIVAKMPDAETVPTRIHSENLLKPRIQIVKKIPSNVVQVADSHGKVKINQSVISENMITPIVINKVNGNISGIRKVIQLKKNTNQKPIILPISLKNGTDIRSIKIIKPSSFTKSPKILMAASNLLQEYRQNEKKQNTVILNKPIKVESKYDDDSMSDPSDCESYKFEDMIIQDNEDDDDETVSQTIEHDHQSEYPKLVLSGEEKRLLAKEGIKLPTHYPLTKQEERELKRIRRKIRNKISAQDSRKRKKEYVDGLEERVKKCTDENQNLLKKIKMLQSQNQNLLNQMKKMQNLLTKGGNKSVQPATCLMVLLMSMALIAAPNLKLSKETTDEAFTQEIQMENNDIQQNRRTLLYDSKEKFSDMVADEEMSADFNMLYDKTEHNYAEMQEPSTNKIGQLIDFDVDDTVWEPKINASCDKITTSSQSLIANCDPIGAKKIEDFIEFKDISGTTFTHAKMAKNRSDPPSNDGYKLKLSSDDITKVIDLNLKNV